MNGRGDGFDSRQFFGEKTVFPRAEIVGQDGDLGAGSTAPTKINHLSVAVLCCRVNRVNHTCRDLS